MYIRNQWLKTDPFLEEKGDTGRDIVLKKDARARRQLEDDARNTSDFSWFEAGLCSYFSMDRMSGSTVTLDTGEEDGPLSMFLDFFRALLDTHIGVTQIVDLLQQAQQSYNVHLSSNDSHLVIPFTFALSPIALNSEGNLAQPAVFKRTYTKDLPKSPENLVNAVLVKAQDMFTRLQKVPVPEESELRREKENIYGYGFRPSSTVNGTHPQIPFSERKAPFPEYTMGSLTWGRARVIFRYTPTGKGSGFLTPVVVGYLKATSPREQLITGRHIRLGLFGEATTLCPYFMKRDEERLNAYLVSLTKPPESREDDEKGLAFVGAGAGPSGTVGFENEGKDTPRRPQTPTLQDLCMRLATMSHYLPYYAMDWLITHCFDLAHPTERESSDFLPEGSYEVLKIQRNIPIQFKVKDGLVDFRDILERCQGGTGKYLEYGDPKKTRYVSWACLAAGMYDLALRNTFGSGADCLKIWEWAARNQLKYGRLAMANSRDDLTETFGPVETILEKQLALYAELLESYPPAKNKGKRGKAA